MKVKSGRRTSGQETQRGRLSALRLLAGAVAKGGPRLSPTPKREKPYPEKGRPKNGAQGVMGCLDRKDGPGKSRRQSRTKDAKKKEGEN